jgi:Fic family protein
MGNLFDVIGSAHYIKSSTSTAAATRVSMNNLVEVANNILEDSSCLIRMEQLLELHKCILDASSGQAGVLRPGTAVGYVEPGIYRVFLPAGEVSTALQSYLGVLNARDRWQQRPLLCAYYAFAALVFFIHPFHDGNGRCARILGSVVAMKLGFRPILRASDKTLTLGQFLQKHAML